MKILFYIGRLLDYWASHCPWDCVKYGHAIGTCYQYRPSGYDTTRVTPIHYCRRKECSYYTENESFVRKRVPSDPIAYNIVGIFKDL